MLECPGRKMEDSSSETFLKKYLRLFSVDPRQLMLTSSDLFSLPSNGHESSNQFQ